MKVQRYEVELGQNPVQMPDGAVLLGMLEAVRGSSVYVLAQVDTSQPLRERRVYVAEHDQDLPAGVSGWTFVGRTRTRVPPMRFLFAWDAGWAP